MRRTSRCGVALAVDPRCLKLGAPGDDHSVGQLLAWHPERAQDPGHGCDAVALFDAKLGGVADLGLAVGDGGERTHGRDLVDHANDELTARHRAADCAMSHGQLRHRLVACAVTARPVREARADQP